MMFGDLLAFAGALWICLNAGTIGRALGVMDHPDNERKLHIGATPLVGGIAILVPLLLWLGGNLLSDSAADTGLRIALLLCGAGVGALGFADDKTPISPLARVLLVAVILDLALFIHPQLIAPGLNWASLVNLAIPVWVAVALSMLSAVGIVNAVNMADGQNGLVPSLFLIWSGCLMLVGDRMILGVAEVLFGLSLVVLIFNLRGKLFLGSCGSYGVTFVLGVLTMLAHAQGRIPIETIIVWLFIPVVDCLRLCAARLLRGRSPMAPDTDHFHHRLQDKLGNQYGLFAYLGIVAASSLVAALAPRLSLVCIVVLTAIYLSFASLTDSAVMRTSEGGNVSQRTRERRSGLVGAASMSGPESSDERELF